jgi:hypothetical protein
VPLYFSRRSFVSHFRQPRLIFCAAAARKNCSRTNFKSSQTQAPQSDLILQFREQGFHLLSLPLWRDSHPQSTSAFSRRTRNRGFNNNYESLLAVTPLPHRKM